LGQVISLQIFVNLVFESQDAKGEFKMAFNASLEIKCSRELKISGSIGSCVSAKKKDQSISEIEIGIGKRPSPEKGGFFWGGGG
jgi:hypothetical protein